MAVSQERIEAVRRRIEQACLASGRNPSEVKIVAISKGFPSEAIEEVARCGVMDIGENYLQESLPKQESLKHLPIVWHFTGHVQRNKAFSIASHFQFIHSVDTLRLAKSFNDAGEKLGKRVRVFFQLKCKDGGYGFPQEEFLQEAPDLAKLSRIEPMGIMIMPPPFEKPEIVRPFFRGARDVYLQARNFFSETFRELSMGMTEDFSVAVEEGATLVRIGRGIFGKRF